MPLQFIDLGLVLVRNILHLKISDASFKIMIIGLVKYIGLCMAALKIETNLGQHDRFSNFIEACSTQR